MALRAGLEKVLTRLRVQDLHASMAFTLITGGLDTPCPALTGGNAYDAAGFASCYVPHRRSPLQGS